MTRTTPRNLTRTALNELRRDDLAAWAEGRALLEHLDRDEVAALTKKELVHEIEGALLRIDVELEHRAFAYNTVRRGDDIANYIGGLE